MIFKHQFMDEFPFVENEVNTGEYLVETAGYISPQKQIEGMINAGIRLQLARDEEFDLIGDPDVDLDQNFDDPTRHPGFDMSDASILANAMLERTHNRMEEPQILKNQKKEQDGSESTPLPEDLK